MTGVIDIATEGRRGNRVFLNKAALGAVAACFLLMGALAAAYGPLLEHLARRFEISLPVASEVFSAHFAGALVGVLVSMWAMERASGRLSVWTALGCLGLGCAGVALAASWPAFLTGVFVIGQRLDMAQPIRGRQPIIQLLVQAEHLVAGPFQIGPQPAGPTGLVRQA